MIRIKLSYSWLQALYRMHYHWSLEGRQDDHIQLLAEHNDEFTHLLALKIRKMIGTTSKTCTIKFSSLQALAFTQLWLASPVPAEDLGAVVIGHIIALINRQHENNKRVVRFIP